MTTTFAVSAATGQLGNLAVQALLDQGVPSDSVVATTRSPDRAEQLARLGVTVREADYLRPESLAAAFAGVDRLLLISSNSEPRLAQHANAVKAATQAGVNVIAYTSVLNAESTTMQLAADHQATEELLRDSGTAYVLLRNGWYTENYTQDLELVLEHGISESAGDGRVALAPRADFAEAAAIVLTGGAEHAGRAYELAGDDTPSLDELAALIARESGREVAYQRLTVDAYTDVLTAAGVPAPMNAIYADASAAIERGELLNESGDLARLLGRPTTPVAETVRAAVQRLQS